MHRHIYDVTTAIDKQWQSTRRQKNSELHHQVEFLCNYYTFESMHDGDHDGIVRLFVGLSCELGGFFSLRHRLHYITLHCVEQFFYYQECNITLQVATALLVAGFTLTFWIPPFASTSSYSSVVQSARLARIIVSG